MFSCSGGTTRFVKLRPWPGGGVIAQTPRPTGAQKNHGTTRPAPGQFNNVATALTSSLANAGLATTGASGHFCLASVAS